MDKMDNEKIKKVAIIDFDGTLIDTQLPDEGKKIWLAKTGEKYPHVGWWSKKETLDINIFENKPFDDIVEAYNLNKEKKNTYLVLCTGRIIKMTDQVNAILDKYNFKFDDVILNGDRRYSGKGMDNDTMSYKLRVFADMIKKFPNLEEIEIWDDRHSHHLTFKQWADERERAHNNLKITIHLVHEDGQRH